MQKNGLLFGVAVCLFFTSTAPASLIVSPGNNPGPNEENVLLNGVSGPGTLITGTTNQSNVQVKFTSTNQLIGNPNGESFITGAGDGTGVNGGTFSNITISLANSATFTDLIFALNLPPTGDTSSCSACVKYSVTGTANGSGTLPGTIGPGTTFFTFV